MVLVDSSVWIDHFRAGQHELAHLLAEGLVFMHPFIRGELACGNLKNRVTLLSDLKALPQAHRASDADVMHLLDVRRLWGRGLGWVDIHLLAAALVSNCRLWTLDKRLDSAASALDLSYRRCRDLRGRNDRNRGLPPA
jgi:predicted nucleic acid-binding protein